MSENGCKLHIVNINSVEMKIKMLKNIKLL